MAYQDNAYGLQKLHGQLLDMMIEIDAVCRKHGVEYSLLGGTMLGAVREGGFIPWDDDLDLVFTAGALETFARVFPQESERYTVALDDTWVARVVPRAPIDGERPFVDLFHYEPISQSAAARKVKVLLLQLLQGMLKEDAEYSRFSLKNRILLKTTHMLGKLFSKPQKLRMYRWVSRHVARGDGSLLHISDEQFGCLHLTYPAAYAQSYQDIPFESATLRVTSHYDEWLRWQYGDYMTPPPEAERVTRHDAQRKKA